MNKKFDPKHKSHSNDAHPIATGVGGPVGTVVGGAAGAATGALAGQKIADKMRSK